MSIKAMVFAAGLGTRLYPLTANRPKALVRMNGIPLLQHVLDKIIASGIDNIVVNVHHFPDQIIDFIKGHPFQADIRISDERAYLRDTAGGLKFAEPFLDNCDAILLYNTDIITSLSIPDLIAHHEKSEALLMFKTDSFLSVLDRLLAILFCGMLLWGHLSDKPFRIEWFVYCQTAAYLLAIAVALFIVLKKSKLRRLAWNKKLSLLILKKSLPFALLTLLMAFYNRIDSVDLYPAFQLLLL